MKMSDIASIFFTIINNILFLIKIETVYNRVICMQSMYLTTAIHYQ